MTDKQDTAFNPEAMLGNVSYVKDMIKRIRQKDGGVGSQEDELSLHRAISDTELLAGMVTGLRSSLVEIQRQANEAIAARDNMINELEKRIQSLQGPSKET